MCPQLEAFQREYLVPEYFLMLLPRQHEIIHLSTSFNLYLSKHKVFIHFFVLFLFCKFTEKVISAYSKDQTNKMKKKS